MHTRNSYFPNNSSVTILRRRNKRHTPNVVKPELRTIVEVAPMADNQTMDELLQAPTEGYGEAIVIPKINAYHFEIKTNLLQLNRVSTSGTLPSNTILNLKGEMRAITTRSGVAYEGPLILTNPSPKKVVEREIEETTDKDQTNFQGNAILLMPKFASTIKSLLTNKDKLFELAKIPLNENCSAMLLKKLPEKLGDPDKFLIPCDFSGMDTTRYSSTYDDLSVNRIDIIDVAKEEYAQEIHVFSKNSSCSNPTSTSEPSLSNSSPSLTPFEGSDFILEQIKAYLKDKSISPKINRVDCDPEGDICLIENFLNNDPFQLPPMDLKQGEVVKEKSLIEEPPELELKELLLHLEYAYLEGEDKFPVIIAKDLKDNEKEALIKVLNSHKQVIAWKITDI
nr:reverse transcriptase domain-containing protein [Tanacetum cinerariifolium]